MKRLPFVLFMLAGLPLFLKAQSPQDAHAKMKFPIIASVHFQNLSVPFADIKSHFSHPGFSVGTEMSLNTRKTLFQQLHAGATLNRELGNHFFVQTQFTYRQGFLKTLYAEARAGLGWQRSYHPVEALRFEGGQWISTAGGRSQVTMPFSLSFGYRGDKENPNTVQPFVGYQLVPALFYNAVIPLNFYTMFHAGVRVQL